MALTTLVANFLEYLELERNASQLTIRNYDHYLKRFLEFSKDIEPKSIDLKLVKSYKFHLSHWQDPLTGKSLKPVTQNYFMIALRAFLKYLDSKGIATLSSDQVELGKQDSSSLKVLDETQLKQILERPDSSKIEGLRDRAILETLFSTGLRVAELTSLNTTHVTDGSEFTIKGKGGKERVIFLTDSAEGWINRYLEARKDAFKPLFIRFQGKVNLEDDGEAMRLTSRSIERIVEKYVKEAGLSVKATPHTLRHSFATDLLINGADIHSVQEMLGHSNLATTKIYNSVTSPHLNDIPKPSHTKGKT
jgi:site-specific recombinase XerD